MNILFLSIGDVSSMNISDHGVYTDLIRAFRDKGHNICVVCPRERRYGLNTELTIEYGVKVLRVKIGNITKTNIIEKGLSTILIEQIFKKMIRKYFGNIQFDLVLYTTPPITFSGVVKYVKKRDGAKSYLMLKDIFPQNAVDLQMFSPNSLLYRYFRQKEKQLYALSDFIGCMSPANVQYLLSHNQDIDPAKVEVCPNCIEIRDICLSQEEKLAIRDKYGLPREKTIFVYGGNLGKPQGIPFLLQCLKAQKDNKQAYFLIVGSGTDCCLIEKFIREENPKNVKLIQQLPRDEFDMMISNCDVGLIFLDHRFTIPNFPSRLLSYMQAGLPVLACSDPNTDIGETIVEGGFGWWCESNSEKNFTSLINDICYTDLTKLGYVAYTYLAEHYMVDKCYETIMGKLTNENRCE